MVINGYVKDHKYEADGTLVIQVRIPSIHGPMDISDYRGKIARNYVRDEDLPYYSSLILPRTPEKDDVVVLISKNDKTTEFIVLGLTGAKYNKNLSNLGG